MRRIPCSLQLPWWWRCKIIENKYKLWTDCITGIKVNIEDKIHIEYPIIQSYKYYSDYSNIPFTFISNFQFNLDKIFFRLIPFSPELFKVNFKIVDEDFVEIDIWDPFENLSVIALQCKSI